MGTMVNIGSTLQLAEVRTPYKGFLKLTVSQLSSQKEVFKCRYCESSFTVKGNCTRHEKHCCANKELPSPLEFSCSNCKASYSRKDYLKVHSQKCTVKKKTSTISRRSLAQNQNKSKTPCLVEGCTLQFFHKARLIDHLKSAHKNDIFLRDPVCKMFTSIKEFNTWKAREEDNTFSFFSQKNGQSASLVKHFYCQHDGSASFHSLKKTNRCNKKGRIKIGHHCIAKMKMWKNVKNMIQVEYLPTHSHLCKREDYQHRPLSETTNKFINQQIAQGVPPSEIFKRVQKSCFTKGCRDGLFDKNNILKRIRERARKKHKANKEFHNNVHLDKNAILQKSHVGIEEQFVAMIMRLEANLSFLNSFLASARQKEASEHILQHVDAVITDLVLHLELSPTNKTKNKEISDELKSTENLNTSLNEPVELEQPHGNHKYKGNLSELAYKRTNFEKDLLKCLSYGNTEEIVCTSDEDSNLSETEHDLRFTLPKSYVYDPSDHVLQCGEKSISLIQLKTLEPTLPFAEEEKYQEKDRSFQVGWVHSSIINAFLFKISEKNENVYFMSSNFALRASNNLSNVNSLKEKLNELYAKKIIFLPANISNNHWMILVIMLQEGEIMYYDPLQERISKKCSILLSQTAIDMTALFPSTPEWKITIVQLPKESDPVNCGPVICHFAEQTAQCVSYTTLEFHLEFRRYMYSFIVGNCLKRSYYAEESCGKCGVKYDKNEDSQIWIRCVCCQQWFHDFCVDFPNRFSDNFVCP